MTAIHAALSLFEEYFDNTSSAFRSNFSIYQSLLYCEKFCWHHEVEIVFETEFIYEPQTINYRVFLVLQ